MHDSDNQGTPDEVLATPAGGAARTPEVTQPPRSDDASIRSTESSDDSRSQEQTDSSPGGAHRWKDGPLPRRIVLLNAVSAAVSLFALLLGFLANYAAVEPFLKWRGIVALAIFALGLSILQRLRQRGRLPSLWNLTDRSARAWTVRLAPVVCFVLSAIIALTGLVSKEGSADFRGDSTTPSPIGGCAGVVAGRPAEFSHLRLATAANQDKDVNFKTGGYVQQRFFAQSEYVSSLAVIVSRPPLAGQTPFDPSRIGRIRLTLYEANDKAENTAEIPLALLDSDRPAVKGGITMMAGPSHQEAVFRFCPVKLQVKRRYAFRVTNVEPNVILAFSLSTMPGPDTSIDVIGTANGQDRRRINYHQVAGYVCSLPEC